MKRSRGRASIALVAAASLGVAMLAACTPNEGSTGGSSPDANAQPITVWTADTLPDRVAKTEAIIEKFTAKTGVKVDLVGVPEDQFNQVLTSSAAAGDLPDVIGSISLAQVRTLSANDLVDTESNGAVVKNLDEKTFTGRALELTRDGDKQLSVPDSSWQQLLYYRKDLFEKAGIAPPKTYDDIKAAAEKLDSPQLAGLVAANKPGEAFTQQTFEHVAQGNGCEMVNDQGEITFDSPECVGALTFYRDMLKNYSVPGAQDVDTVRASYFAGQAAMSIWSTFILDEMAGLRNDAKPTCAECKADPAFLAKNTGVVTGIQGPDGEQPAQFGEIVSWTITKDSASDSARKFVEYFMTEGYADWLAIAPEGRLPVRGGTADKPTEYADKWKTMPAGVDKKEPLGNFYSEDVLSVLQKGPADLKRWGITQGQGDLVGAALGELPVAKAVSDVTSGGVDPETAAKQAAEALRSIQGSLK
ncbi:MAG: bicyclomycin resistance protein [Arthrobacter sp.]|nr:bicyclomycin resistance protein [Arthrobacter sp.]MCE3244016.1 bicyclomycin resistance protein [Arthrobacter sp.]MCE3291333.1 bicyclomycin resistance protein [Arthrobacter sp.]